VALDVDRSGIALACGPLAVANAFLGIAHPSAWIAWLVLDVEGIALPELVGAGLLATWGLGRYRPLRG
jgi:hypothetical protein